MNGWFLWVDADIYKAGECKLAHEQCRVAYLSTRGTTKKGKEAGTVDCTLYAAGLWCSAVLCERVYVSDRVVLCSSGAIALDWVAL